MCQLLAKNNNYVNQIESDIPPLQRNESVDITFTRGVRFGFQIQIATEGWDEDPPRDHTPGTCSGSTPVVTRSGHLGSLLNKLTSGHRRLGDL